MEDQGVQSPQTFLVKSFSNLQPQRKHDGRCASKHRLPKLKIRGVCDSLCIKRIVWENH